MQDTDLFQQKALLNVRCPPEVLLVQRKGHLLKILVAVVFVVVLASLLLLKILVIGVAIVIVVIKASLLRLLLLQPQKTRLVVFMPTV